MAAIPRAGAAAMMAASPLRAVAPIVAIAVAAFAFGLYALVRESPPDGAGAASPPRVDADAPAPVSREALARHLERQPRDGRAWVMLARIDFEANRYADAAASYARALDVSPKVAADALVWCEYADALGMEAGGTLAGKPRELVMHALALAPGHPRALEMAGSAAFEAGDYALAVRYWRELLAKLPESSSAERELAAAIARAELLAAQQGT